VPGRLSVAIKVESVAEVSINISMLVTDCADSYLLVPFYAFVDSVGLQLAGRPS